MSTLESNKKVGIINYHYSNHNYGAVLQAAALHYYINIELGYSSEHISYIPKAAKVSSKAKIKSYIKSLLMGLGLKDKKITHDSFVNPEIFQEFRDKWLPTSSEIFHNFADLKEAKLDYSHVVVGSDQVWRPSYTGSSSLVYFLAFADKSVKRISYAASFGNDYWELNDEDTAEIANEVKLFSAVSVRENSGLQICKTAFNVNAQHVLDPTLLVGQSFFEKIIGVDCKVESTDIVYYKLDIDSDFESFIKLASSRLSFNNKNIYYKSKGLLNYYNPVNVWLQNIRKSKLVITDSFHCVCFAILFEIPFVYYPNDNRGLSRLESLLGLLGLSHHIFSPNINPDKLLKNVMNIDYQDVNHKLALLREKSSKFLKEALI